MPRFGYTISRVLKNGFARYSPRLFQSTTLEKSFTPGDASLRHALSLSLSQKSTRIPNTAVETQRGARPARDLGGVALARGRRHSVEPVIVQLPSERLEQSVTSRYEVLRHHLEDAHRDRYSARISPRLFSFVFGNIWRAWVREQGAGALSSTRSLSLSLERFRVSGLGGLFSKTPCLDRDQLGASGNARDSRRDRTPRLASRARPAASRTTCQRKATRHHAPVSHPLSRRSSTQLRDRLAPTLSLSLSFKMCTYRT